MMSGKLSSTKVVLLILTIWLSIALVVGGAGWLRPAPAPAIAATVGILTSCVFVASRKVHVISQWTESVDLRAFVSLHLSRFVGIYFLILANGGQLSPSFARPAGFGDCIAAVGALLLLVFWRYLDGNALLLIWNTFGLLDIVLVVALALRVGLRNWGSMSPLRELPLSLLPTFLVPLIIVSHIFIFIRVARANTAR